MTTKKAVKVFSYSERAELISMVEHVLLDDSVSYSKLIKGYRVTCKAIPNSQRCVLSFVDTDKSKFKN